jgi:hypothetical protein
MDNQIDHMLVDKRRHSSVFNIRSLIGTDLVTDCYLVVTEVRGRLQVSIKQHKVFYGECNLKKVNDVEVGEQYQVKI